MSQKMAITNQQRFNHLIGLLISFIILFQCVISIQYAMVPRIETDCKVLNSTSEFKICRVYREFGNCQYTNLTFELNWEGLVIIKNETIIFSQPAKITDKIECYFRQDTPKETLTIDIWNLPDRSGYGFLGGLGLILFSFLFIHCFLHISLDKTENDDIKSV